MSVFSDMFDRLGYFFLYWITVFLLCLVVAMIGMLLIDVYRKYKYHTPIDWIESVTPIVAFGFTYILCKFFFLPSAETDFLYSFEDIFNIGYIVIVVIGPLIFAWWFLCKILENAFPNHSERIEELEKEVKTLTERLDANE